jgi:diacylglycerol kinase
MGGGEDELVSQGSQRSQGSQIGHKDQIGHMSQLRSDSNKFSIRKRVKSFIYAFAGIRHFISSQHNARIHLAATAAVILLSVLFHVSGSEAIVLTFAVGMVWVCEIFNTVIERIMDFISVERNYRIKLIKDMSAAAVLVSALTAFVVGCFVFIPKF